MITASIPSSSSDAQAPAIGYVVNMRYGRQHVLESDRLGIRFIAEAGYGLRSMLGLLELLAASDQGEVAGPSSAVHHPSPERCIERIHALIGHLCKGCRLG